MNLDYFARGYRIGFAAVLVLGASVSWSATHIVNQDGSGDFTHIQAAVDAAEDGDEIIVYGGTYEEDLTIGHLNSPPLRKNNLTIKAAPGEDVLILIPNQADRVQGLPFDFGEQDILGVFINGDGVTLEGLRIEQPTTVTNDFVQSSIAAAVTVVSSNVTLRDCVIEGSATYSGDILGVLVVNLDFISALQGANPTLARNFLMENCTLAFHNFAFAINNFLRRGTGADIPNPTARIVNCEFEFNGTGVEMDDGEVEVENCLFADNGTGVSVSQHRVDVRNSRFIANTSWGVYLETGDLDDGAPEEIPVVNVEDSFFKQNGVNPDHAAFRVRTGTLNVIRTIVTQSGGVDVRFDTVQNRHSTVNLINSDFYKPGAGVHLLALSGSQALVDLTTLNSIFVGENLYDNQADVLLEENFTYSNYYLEGAYNIGEEIFGVRENNSSENPLYVDPDNDDFSLQPTSPLVNRAQDGGHLGALGVVTSVFDWAIQ